MTCEQCGRVHSPKDPHDPYTSQYIALFWKTKDRLPTWQDALAHCTETVREEWRGELKRLGKYTTHRNPKRSKYS